MTDSSPKTSGSGGAVSIVVTVDGPAASGKSSVSREIAGRFGWSWVSTGMFYRGLAYVAARLDADIRNEDALAHIANSNRWSVQPSRDTTRVFFQGRDVTDEVSGEETGGLASIVSQFPKVRKALLEAQRRCAAGVAGLVAEGRDCGTVVFPDADVKVFLTARAEDRAARRARDEGKSVDETRDAQKIRDAQDTTRKTAPLQAAVDAQVIDTSELSLGDVVFKVESLIRESLGDRLRPRA